MGLSAQELSEKRALFLEFQKRWSLERVKNMTLGEYTGIGQNRDDFTYWIEYKLDLLNKRNPTKFGIWKNNNEEKQTNRASYNGDYGWFNSLKEKTPQQAFEKMKSYIVRLIRLSQGNHLDEIDEIVNIEKLIGYVCAWKIAFCYQNINDMRILCIFSKNILQNIAKGESLGENLSTAQIYQKLLSDKTYTLEMMMEEKFTPLWKKYNNQKQKMQESNNSSQNNLQDSKKNQIPLNQILYGPPGTGKTYQTIDRALEILESYGQIDSIPDDRDERKRIFDEYKFDKDKANGQIAFITFHQNFSYEEFVEGIKPDIKNSENMIYELQNGIFKVICEKARTNYQEYQESNKESKDRQQVDTQELFQAYALSLKQDVDEGKKLDFCDSSKIKICSINLKNNGEVKSISIGTNAESALQSLTQEIILRDYQDFKSGIIKDYKDIKPTYESKSPWHGNAIYYFELYKKLQEFEQKEFKPQIISKEQAKLKPYILIIDEINRGNISKILGELITLIEPSKRIGEDEALEVTLPYSQESFGVSNNLYIIGTMNTADRSIALLDTALRRRFEFVEMMPKPDILKSCENVDLKQLLEKMNNRIEFLLDREHTIGHAYFIDVKTLEDLQAVFAKKIIPLLQEYFYEDYAKIDAVLNRNGMLKVEKEVNFNELFDSNKFSDFDNEKTIYKITDSSRWGIETFQKIYNKKATESSNKENDEN